MGHIYKIVNDINNKVYIGQTHYSLRSRWKSHKHLGLIEKSNAHIYRAMRKYGVEHFEIQNIEDCDDDKLDEREMYWISEYDSYENGYNSTLGGRGHRKYNADDIKNAWDSGMNLRKIYRKFNIQPNTVKKILDDYQPFIEGREKRYLDAVNNKAYERIPVKQFSIDGQFLAIYPSISEASRQNNVSSNNIVSNCKGKSKYAKGYQWRYAYDDTPVGAVKLPEVRVVQTDANMNIINVYPSIKIASESTGFNALSISRVCRTRTMYKGFYWSHEDAM